MVPEEAHLFRSFLSSREIDGYVFDENLVQMAWYYSYAIGGVRVMVGDDDSEAAARHYKQYSAALRRDSDLETTVRSWPVVAAISMIVGAPALIFGRKNRWRSGSDRSV